MSKTETAKVPATAKPAEESQSYLARAANKFWKWANKETWYTPIGSVSYFNKKQEETKKAKEAYEKQEIDLSDVRKELESELEKACTESGLFTGITEEEKKKIVEKLASVSLDTSSKLTADEANKYFNERFEVQRNYEKVHGVRAVKKWAAPVIYALLVLGAAEKVFKIPGPIAAVSTAAETIDALYHRALIEKYRGK